MEDLSATGRSKRKNFFFRLVRPWKWRIRKHRGKNAASSELMGVKLCSSPYLNVLNCS